MRSGIEEEGMVGGVRGGEEEEEKEEREKEGEARHGFLGEGVRGEGVFFSSFVLKRENEGVRGRGSGFLLLRFKTREKTRKRSTLNSSKKK